jgi:hypothetical protein
MRWINPQKPSHYLGDRAAFWHIPASSDHPYPGPGHRPLVEGGEERVLDQDTILVGAVHIGWEVLPSPPKIGDFVAEFVTPGANTLYSSVASKVGAAGFAAQDHWQNLKAVVTEGRINEIPAAIAYLDQLLVAAGQPLSETDINGDTEQGDPYNGWNTLCDRYHFPENCKL